MRKFNGFISVVIPTNVSVTKENEKLVIAGPLGKLSVNLKSKDTKGILSYKLTETTIDLAVLYNTKHAFAFVKTLASLLEQKIKGVYMGYMCKMEVKGVGYRVSVENTSDVCNLVFKLGYSMDKVYKLPKYVKAFSTSQTSFCLYGLDKSYVNEVAAKLIALRTPDAYQGKGVLKTGTVVRLKQVKKR